MNLMKYKYLYFLISLLIIVPGLFSLVRYGLKPSIDFTGGSLLEVSFTEAVPTQSEITEVVSQTYPVESVQNVGQNDVIIRGADTSNEAKATAVAQLQEKYGSVEEKRFATVGPTLSGELLRKTMTAVALVAGFILFYIWSKFTEIRFGVSALLAMFHDSLVLLGIFSLLGHFFGVEVDILFVTALLTTLSFSVHDTIVVYDRIRELRRKNLKGDFESLVGAAVLETLGRSINNSMTIIIMLLALVLLGGESIKWFSVALLIGAITGTYSSTFIAAPLLLVFDRFMKRK